MQHLATRTPPGVFVSTKPSHIYGWLATATDSETGRTAEAWGATELDARQRAECLACLREFA
jgi:hypothetical protein